MCLMLQRVVPQQALAASLHKPACTHYFDTAQQKSTEGQGTWRLNGSGCLDQPERRQQCKLATLWHPGASSWLSKAESTCSNTHHPAPRYKHFPTVAVAPHCGTSTS